MAAPVLRMNVKAKRGKGRNKPKVGMMRAPAESRRPSFRAPLPSPSAPQFGSQQFGGPPQGQGASQQGQFVPQQQSAPPRPPQPAAE